VTLPGAAREEGGGQERSILFRSGSSNATPPLPGSESRPDATEKRRQAEISCKVGRYPSDLSIVIAL
jgi:hypothetical protein